MPADCIKVFVRFRPRNARELAENPDDKGKVFITPDTGEILIKADTGDQKFTFDCVFPIGTTQEQVFEQSGASIVDNVLAGFNSTMFAYGQTGAGKTFSLVGKLDTPELYGVMPRAARYLFDKIGDNPEIKESSVIMMASEVYNEKLQDLFNNKKEVRVRQKRNGTTYIEGIVENKVTNMEEVFERMTEGFNNRSVAATKMNAESSRSHCIFCIMLKCIMTDGQVRNSRLYIIDLAGSERVSKTGATGQTLEEAKNINSSLTALGNVIGALSSGKGGHIPFRDSVLTFLLKDSLQGNTKTALFAAATMDTWNLDETISTMRFAKRAKTISNKVKVNRDFSPAELKKLMAKNKDALVQGANLFLSLQKEKFDKKKCETYLKEFLQDMRDILKEEFPDASKGGALEVRDVPKVAASAAASGGGAPAAAASGGDKPAVASGGDKPAAGGDDGSDDMFDSDGEAEVPPEEKTTAAIGNAMNEAFQKELEEKVSGVKAECEALEGEVEELRGVWDERSGELKEITDKISEYKNELENSGGASEADLPSLDLKENKNDSAETLKYKRDLRVYGYTLKLTRQEWKKNQNLALEKMNAHRKVIAKYKEDKQTLLAIVSDLEAKLHAANDRLREGKKNLQQANELLRQSRNASRREYLAMKKFKAQKAIQEKMKARR